MNSVIHAKLQSTKILTTAVDCLALDDEEWDPLDCGGMGCGTCTPPPCIIPGGIKADETCILPMENNQIRSTLNLSRAIPE